MWKTDLRPVTSDHDEKGAVKTVPMDLSLDESRLQTFHRSVSCSIVNETDVPKSKVFHRGTLSHRDFPASLIKNLDSLMSGSQVLDACFDLCMNLHELVKIIRLLINSATS